MIRFYVEGFREMTVGRTLWAIILIKLFILFAVLKVFFFPDLLAGKSPSEKAGCVLLEPVMKVEVVMPDEYMGDVIGNLTSRRCRIEGTDSRGNAQVVDAICPLSEMFGYATDLRSRTQGRGTFTMQFDHYEQVSEAVAKKILGK